MEAILIAAMAHSIPLLPSFPPDRSIACCKVLSVSRPKITGMLSVIFSCVIPLLTPWQTKSKCLVSPCITEPKVMIASNIGGFS